MAEYQSQENTTSIAVKKDTRSRIRKAMPYETMTYNEFIDVLLDLWEKER
jgi:hypothetical protein